MTSVDGQESRLRGLGLLWPAPLWVLALFFLATGYFDLSQRGIFAPAVAPAVAALMALPLVLVPRWPLLAWWLVFVLSVVSVPFFPRTFDSPLPWPPELAIAAVIVLFAVGLRLRRQVLFAIGALSVLAVVWGLVPTGGRDYSGEPALPVLFVVLLLVLGYLAGGSGRAAPQIVEGERRLAEDQTQPGLDRLVAGAGRLRGLWPAALWWVLALVNFFSSLERLHDYGDLGIYPPVLAALIALPLVLVPRWPLLAWWLLSVVSVWTVRFFPAGSETSLPWQREVAIAAVIVLFAVGLRLRRHVIFAVGGLSVLAVVWGLIATTSRDIGGEPAAPVAFVVMLLALGYLASGRGRAQLQVAEGERRLEEVQTRRAVLEERARIARELHDVVAHHMSMVAVQAETAPFRVADLPATSREVLAEIGYTAREALTEMRRLLGVLRSVDTDAELAPQPGLDQLDRLVTGARRAGNPVESVVTGTPRPLPPGVDLSAYRIVQEALSNAVSHAPGALLRVETRHEPTHLRLRVANDAPPGPRPQPGPWGHGLLGMRERVAMLGGEFTAEPTPDGGYLVEAVLPVAADGAG